MYKQENSEIMSLYSISPVHAGSGTSLGVVDLPIQRERHTNWPHIQASGVKGAMRHHFDKLKDDNIKNGEQNESITEKIFGTENFEENSLPGAISVSDAKLIAFPVRSSKKPFVWVTSPSALKRAERDMKLTGFHEPAAYKSPDKATAYVIKGDVSGKILLEDYEVDTEKDESFNFSGIYEQLLNKAETLLLIHDDIYDYVVSNCIEVQTQIKIDSEKGVTVDGSLRYQEVLPSDSVMYCILFYGRSRNSEATSPIQAETLIQFLKNDVIKSHIQIGGDETLGRGLFEIEWIKKEGGNA